MRDVLQNTARKFKIYMADSSAPTTPKTGLASFTVYLTKEGGAEFTVSPTITERGHGWYEVTPTTAHRDTLGCNAWTFVASGAVDFPRLETVVLYDAQLAAVGAMPIYTQPPGFLAATFPTDPADHSVVIGATNAILTAVSDVQTDVDASNNYLVIALARLGSWTGTGINTILGAFRAAMGKAAALTPTDISNGTTYDNTLHSLQSIRERGDEAWITGGGSGTGARTVTITVNDGATALQNAIVRMTEGVNSYTAITNVSGVAVFNLDDATWTVSITKVGYTYAGTTILVNGNETAIYSMTAIVITPGTGNLTTGFLTCFDETGAAEEDVTIYCQMTDPPESDTGSAYDTTLRSEDSAVDGLVEFVGLHKGATYNFWRGKLPTGTQPVSVTIPAAANPTYALPSVIGRE